MVSASRSLLGPEGNVFPVASRNPDLAATIAHSPLADGQPAMLDAMRHTTPLALACLTGRALLDALGRLVGRDPLLVTLTGEPGTVAARSALRVGWDRNVAILDRAA